MSDEWCEAWGGDNDYDYYYSNDWYGHGGDNGLGYIGNVAMLLERGGTRTGETKDVTTADNKILSSKTACTSKIEIVRVKGETKTCNENIHDPLRNTKRRELVTVHNRFHTLTNNDDDDDSEEQVSEEEMPSEATRTIAASNKRKRKQNTKRRHHNDDHIHNNYDLEIDAAIRGAVESECNEKEWRAVTPVGYKHPQGWHPGPEHTGA